MKNLFVVCAILFGVICYFGWKQQKIRQQEIKFILDQLEYVNSILPKAHIKNGVLTFTQDSDRDLYKEYIESDRWKQFQKGRNKFVSYADANNMLMIWRDNYYNLPKNKIETSIYIDPNTEQRVIVYQKLHIGMEMSQVVKNRGLPDLSIVMTGKHRVPTNVIRHSWYNLKPSAIFVHREKVVNYH